MNVSGLIEKKLESKHRIKKAKMQLRNKIPRQTQVRDKIAHLHEISGFVNRDFPHSPYAHLTQNYILYELNEKILIF